MELEQATYGNFHVRIKRSERSQDLNIVLVHRDPTTGKLTKAYFDGPDLIFSEIAEGVAIDFEEDSFLNVSPMMEDMARDMFFALARAFGMDTDAERARNEGMLLGENKVLWAWVQSERPHSGDLSSDEDLLPRFYAGAARRKTPYISPLDTPGG
jgi:hypothetical protein